MVEIISILCALAIVSYGMLVMSSTAAEFASKVVKLAAIVSV